MKTWSWIKMLSSSAMPRSGCRASGSSQRSLARRLAAVRSAVPEYDNEVAHREEGLLLELHHVGGHGQQLLALLYEDEVEQLGLDLGHVPVSAGCHFTRERGTRFPDAEHNLTEEYGSSS